MTQGVLGGRLWELWLGAGSKTLCRSAGPTLPSTCRHYDFGPKLAGKAVSISVQGDGMMYSSVGIVSFPAVNSIYSRV